MDKLFVGSIFRVMCFGVNDVRAEWWWVAPFLFGFVDEKKIFLFLSLQRTNVLL